jgi:hypothetical protein
MIVLLLFLFFLLVLVGVLNLKGKCNSLYKYLIQQGHLLI